PFGSGSAFSTSSMISRSRSLTSSTRDLNTTSNALRLSRTSSSELFSTTVVCAAAITQRSKSKRIEFTAFILLYDFYSSHHLRCALRWMRQSGQLVFILYLLETEDCNSFSSQGNVIVTFSRVSDQQP